MILTSKYVITHGQFYEVSDDELMHWKYIKRTKVNGKWRYYYHDDDVDKAREELAESGEAYAKARRAADKATKQAADHYQMKDKIADWGKPKWRELQNDMETYAWTKRNTAARARERQQKAAKKYLDTQKKANGSFGSKVADFLNKSTIKVEKATSWLKKIFS